MILRIETHKNPTEKVCKPFSEFLNNGFFDCTVNDFNKTQIYYVAFIGNEIVGARKVLTNFQDYYQTSKWNDRLGEFVDTTKKSYYLQALAVSEKYQNLGIGSLLLKYAIEDIDKNAQIFASLCDTNTIKNKYINEYGFSILKEIENRIVIGRL